MTVRSAVQARVGPSSLLKCHVCMFCNVCSQGDKLFHASGLATELFFRCPVVLGPDRGQNGSNRACALLLASSLLLAMAGSRKLPAARTPMPGSHSSAGQSERLITVRSAVQARVGPWGPSSESAMVGGDSSDIRVCAPGFCGPGASASVDGSYVFRAARRSHSSAG